MLDVTTLADDQIGQLAEDGTITAWPAKDVFGDAIQNHVGPALIRLPGLRFVLAPAGIEVVLATPEPPAPEPEVTTIPEPVAVDDPPVDAPAPKAKRR